MALGARVGLLESGKIRGRVGVTVGETRPMGVSA